jgi:predicted nuclease of predicted toxin-antitoxin system
LRHNKRIIRKAKRFRLLLDAGFAISDLFPKLRKKTNLAHCVFDGGLSPKASDIDIYRLAIKQRRFVLTHDKDFKQFVKPNLPGVLILPSHLSNEVVDALVSKFLLNKNPDNFVGKTVRI